MVKWTNHAKRQLRHIHDYIAQDSPMYARRVSEALVKRTIGLDDATPQRTDSARAERRSRAGTRAVFLPDFVRDQIR
ncbi:MAG: hypothetical protein GKR94_14120 [Gammaproteobacteria bacterium]|nr:hypothetical protein [Gammaproteobacteria bacterium]